MDLHLVVGTKTETVEVSGVGTRRRNRQSHARRVRHQPPIVNMPLNGRNVLDLALLQPGVSEDNPDDTGAAISTSAADAPIPSPSARWRPQQRPHGTMTSFSILILTPSLNSASLPVTTLPSTAATAEASSASSSNLAPTSIHGSAFDFIRNTDFDANAYFNKVSGMFFTAQRSQTSPIWRNLRRPYYHSASHRR